MTARRLTIMSTALFALGLAFASPAAAAPDPSICTDSVWSDIPGYSAENAALATAMNALNSRGVDTRAIFLADLGPGINDVPEFERSVLQATCPQLFNVSEPKPDLFMLIVSQGDRSAGTVFGTDLQPYHDESRFSSVADDNFRDGDYAGGLKEYFETVNSRIEQAQNPSAGPAQEQPRQEDSAPINWRPILAGIGIVVGIALFCLLLYVIGNWIRDRKQLQRSREMLLGRSAALREKYTKLVVGDLDSATAGSLLQFLAYWIDKLPDSDDAELRAAREAYDNCVAQGGSRLDAAEQLIRAAKNQDDIENADNEVDDIEVLLRSGSDALYQAEEACTRLAEMDEEFKDELPEAIATGEAIKNRLAELDQLKFKTGSFRDQLTALVDGVSVCQQQYQEGALVSASHKLDAISADLISLASVVDELPERHSRISSRAETQRQAANQLTDSLQGATELLGRLKGTYHSQDLADISTAPEDARHLLDAVRTLIEEALVVGSMERQAFDEADTLLNRSAGNLDEAQAKLLVVKDRATELELLPQRLQTSIDELDTQVIALKRYVEQKTDDIDEDTRMRAGSMHEVLGDLSRRLASSKPPLLEIERELENLDEEVSSCHTDAQEQHRKMDRMRDDVRQARDRAKRRLTEAASYRSYASGRYATADGYFSGMLVGMTLQQQLLHWNEAYTAADAAYDEGYDDYQDAHRPTYSTSSSSSSSFDFGGGSSGHSFSSPSGGGGSSGHSW